MLIALSKIGVMKESSLKILFFTRPMSFVSTVSPLSAAEKIPGIGNAVCSATQYSLIYGCEP